VDEVIASGTAIHIEWTGKYDGKDYPSTGAMSYDSVAVSVRAKALLSGHSKRAAVRCPRDERCLSVWKSSDYHFCRQESAGR